MIDSMTTMDLNLSYRFDISDYNSRLTLAVKNLADERAPLADRYYGYFADAHQDLGPFFYKGGCVIFYLKPIMIKVCIKLH